MQIVIEHWRVFARIADALEKLVSIEEEKLKLYKGYRSLTDKENDDIADIKEEVIRIRKQQSGDYNY